MRMARRRGQTATTRESGARVVGQAGKKGNAPDPPGGCPDEPAVSRRSPGAPETAVLTSSSTPRPEAGTFAAPRDVGPQLIRRIRIRRRDQAFQHGAGAAPGTWPAGGALWFRFLRWRGGCKIGRQQVTPTAGQKAAPRRKKLAVAGRRACSLPCKIVGGKGPRKEPNPVCMASTKTRGKTLTVQRGRRTVDGGWGTRSVAPVEGPPALADLARRVPELNLDKTNSNPGVANGDEETHI